MLVSCSKVPLWPSWSDSTLVCSFVNEEARIQEVCTYAGEALQSKPESGSVLEVQQSRHPPGGGTSEAPTLRS